jgi:hypothetical protein
MFTQYETLTLGSTPANESCAQLGSPDYYTKAQAECRRYIDALQAHYRAKHAGRDLPYGCTLKIRSNPHDFGTYYDVVARFDTSNPAAERAAYWLESNAPCEWPEENPEEYPAGYPTCWK